MSFPFFSTSNRFDNCEPIYKSILNNYFDKIYLLNLHKRHERLKMAEKRFQFVDIDDYEIFSATDGSVMTRIWEEFSKTNSYFKNPSYLGCAISHLSIYRDAIENGYRRILIVEDDCRVHRNIQEIFEKHVKLIPEWDELLYLGYIPLSDDCSKWDYNVFSGNYVSSNVFIAKNLWGLYSYGITDSLMRELLDVYDKKFPMELDRYFVTHVQPRNKSYGISPQFFCAEDGYSDNSQKIESSMIERSVDTRYARYIDYV